MSHVQDAQVEPSIKLRNIKMEFAGQPVLRDVDLDILPGEIHGLVGENGSGKSTLIKILAGFHTPVGGTLEVAGQNIAFPLNPGQFRELGFAFVHQDLGLLPSLSVLDNLLVDAYARRSAYRPIRWRREHQQAVELFDRFGVHLDTRRLVGDLTAVERALLAIVRAVQASITAQDRDDEPPAARLLVLDEPTVFLAHDEVEQLYRLVRDLVAQPSLHASVLFVSHDLDEVSRLTHRTTVLRDGKVVGTVPAKNASRDILIRMIVGKDLPTFSAGRRTSSTSEALRAEGLTTASLRNVSVSLAAGEVVGVTGLVGSGYEELLYALYDGRRQARAGRITLPDGSVIELGQMTPEVAVSQRIFLVPVDRSNAAAAFTLTIVDNMTSSVLRRYYRRGLLRRHAMIRDTAENMKRFDVRPPNPRSEFGTLSGGNQQKAVLGKWLQDNPKVLLLHEPTQGVDIGARHQIWTMIEEHRANNCSIVYAGSDYEELARVCGRVIVMNGGGVQSVLSGGEVTKERITQECLSGHTAPLADDYVGLFDNPTVRQDIDHQ